MELLIREKIQIEKLKNNKIYPDENVPGNIKSGSVSYVEVVCNYSSTFDTSPCENFCYSNAA